MDYLHHLPLQAPLLGLGVAASDHDAQVQPGPAPLVLVLPHLVPDPDSVPDLHHLLNHRLRQQVGQVGVPSVPQEELLVWAVAALISCVPESC